MTLPIRNNNGDWSKYIPDATVQVSLNPIFDTNGCGLFGSINCLDMTLFQMTGQKLNKSHRAACVLAGLQNNVDPNGQIWGSYIDADIKSIQQHGVVSQDAWPELTNFNFQQFFAPLSQEAKNSGLQWLKQWKMSDLIPVTEAQVPQMLKTAPVLMQIKFGNGAVHFVVRINQTQYFDSYLPDIKPVGYNGSVILNQWLIVLTPRDMTTGFQQKGSQEVVVPVGDKYVPLSDWGAFVNIGGDVTSIVELDPSEYAKLQIIHADMFKSNS